MHQWSDQGPGSNTSFVSVDRLETTGLKLDADHAAASRMESHGVAGGGPDHRRRSATSRSQFSSASDGERSR